jgi:hypothetical protein
LFKEVEALFRYLDAGERMCDVVIVISPVSVMHVLKRHFFCSFFPPVLIAETADETDGGRQCAGLII